jgi:hypothetical protein
VVELPYHAPYPLQLLEILLGRGVVLPCPAALDTIIPLQQSLLFHPVQCRRVVYTYDPLDPRDDPDGGEAGTRSDVGDLGAPTHLADLGHLLDEKLVVVGKAHGVSVASHVFAELLDVHGAHTKKRMGRWFLCSSEPRGRGAGRRSLLTAKGRIGEKLESSATKSEGQQNMLCAYLSAALLLGLGANPLFGQ